MARSNYITISPEHYELKGLYARTVTNQLFQIMEDFPMLMIQIVNNILIGR